MNRILFYVTDHQRRDTALRLERAGHFDIFYITLKTMDRLDMLTDHPWIDPGRIVDLPTLYEKYAALGQYLSDEQIVAEVAESERLHDIRPLHLLASYNYGRSLKPSDPYSKVVRRIWAEHRIATELLDRARPDACLGELTRSYMVVMHDMARERNIPYISPMELPSSYFGINVMLHSDTAGQSPKLSELYQAYRDGTRTPTEPATEFARALRYNIKNREKATSTYIRNSAQFFKDKLSYRLSHFENWLRAYPIDTAHYPEILSQRNPILTTINNFFVRPMRLKVADKTIRGMIKERPRGEKYIFFPLHFYPEVVSNVWASDFINYYYNELHIVQQLSKQLPTPYRLYVKEHMPMFGTRSPSYYRAVNGLYNVRLFHPSADTFDLMENADLVVTIASFTGFEAFVLGKPVLTFQGAYYGQFSPIHIVDRNRSLHDQMVEAIEGPASTDEDVFPAAAAVYDYVCRFRVGPGAVDSFDHIFSEDSLRAVADFYELIIAGQR